MSHASTRTRGASFDGDTTAVDSDDDEDDTHDLDGDDAGDGSGDDANARVSVVCKSKPFS